MDTMDFKGIAWVGNIYQKFEAMCLEVEETISQETAKYVENQVQTVGATMKRFYSDVMQDLLPPSSTDPVKVAAADLLLNPYTDVGLYKKPKANIKEDNKKPNCIKGISREDNSLTSEKLSLNKKEQKDSSTVSAIGEFSEKDEAACDQMSVILFDASFGAGGHGSRELAGGIDNSVLNESIVSSRSGATVLLKSSVTNGEKVRHISSSKNLLAEHTELDKSRLVSEISPETASDAEHAQSADGKEAFMSHTGGPEDCNLTMPEKTDATEPCMGNNQLDLKSKLEETCILVDEDDFCPVAPEERISPSYKKKIRGAFSLKMKSARKQEYKQLAALHGNLNPESNLKSVSDTPSFTRNLKPKLPSNDLLESEWELI